MGNWHCIPNSCAEVVYQPYETGKVRWRYGSEPWQEIIGADDYTTEIVQNTSLNTSYEVVYRSPVISGGFFQYWNSTEFKTSIGTFNGISNWRMRYVHAGNVIYTNPYCTFNPGDPGTSKRSMQVNIEITSQGTTTTKLLSGGAFGFWALRVQPTNVSLQTTNCIFKVFKKGQLVHQETRSTCPQVEKIPCSLNPVKKSIKIQKIPDLERIEVRNQSIVQQIAPVGELNLTDVSPLPPESLNIYRTYVLAPPILNNFVPLPGQPYLWEFVAQISSAPGCPPPEYEVICDCQCEKCPGDTCPIECGDFICCYNDYGISVQTIAKDKYCGGES